MIDTGACLYYCLSSLTCRTRSTENHYTHVHIQGSIFVNILCVDANPKSIFQECSNEALFGIMEKTLRLLEIGFSEQEISTAFEKCGELIMKIGKF